MESGSGMVIRTFLRRHRAVSCGVLLTLAAFFYAAVYTRVSAESDSHVKRIEIEQQINQLPSLDTVIEELQYMLRNHVLPYLNYTNHD